MIRSYITIHQTVQRDSIILFERNPQAPTLVVEGSPGDSEHLRRLQPVAVGCLQRAVKLLRLRPGDGGPPPPEARARVLFKAAALMRRRKHQFSAWLSVEVGKSWAEADGETAEAIDFLDYYAREMLRLGGPQPLTPYSGEENHLYYRPMGVGVVHSPFNFPLAILCGAVQILRRGRGGSARPGRCRRRGHAGLVRPRPRSQGLAALGGRGRSRCGP